MQSSGQVRLGRAHDLGLILIFPISLAARFLLLSPVLGIRGLISVLSTQLALTIPGDQSLPLASPSLPKTILEFT